MSLIGDAKTGTITADMRVVAEKEHVSPEFIRDGIANGTIIIPKNINRNFGPIGIGRKLTTKINANIGASSDRSDLAEELRKLEIAIKYGTDSVMDLSTGGNLDEIRLALVKNCTVIMGSVPIYTAASEMKHFTQLREQDIFRAIETHAKHGIDYVTVHTGITRKGLQLMNEQGRITDVVSRGGGILAAWMTHFKRENPLCEGFEQIIEIAQKYELTLSLGDSLRPGCLHDATDNAQLHELKTLGEQQQVALKNEVQSMVEGPGHVPLHEIPKNVELQRKYCNDAPFYVLGPLTTDVAPGYDHITSAIGAAVAAQHGAAFLCYVTPAEHLRLPFPDDVKEGVIAYRIAAHAADIAKGIPNARDWDDRMSRARKALDWETQYALAIDPEKAKKMREEAMPKDHKACSMCGTLCSMKITSEYGV